jgi:hypothetical protein
VTAAAAAPVGVDDLRELYARLKGLLLASASRMLLDEPLDGLAAAANALLADCRDVAGKSDAVLSAPLNSCQLAAAEVRDMLEEADTAGVGASRIASVRASHSRLRQEVWRFIPCEYVPCSAAHAHER